jgi:O-acetyl-ADP-ribose deacetylase (regulator of RNase III)
LPAHHVIHTVGPVWSRGDRDEEALDRLLASCYRTSLALAAERHLGSIAFPAISTGIYAFPADRAARIAVATVMSGVGEAGGPDHVIFCCFGRDAARYHEDAFWALGLRVGLTSGQNE